MMGINGLCLLLTVDPIFPRGFGVVLSFAPCLELQQLSLLGERSAASLDWRLELGMEQISPDLCPSALFVPLVLPSSTTSSWEAPPEGSRPSQVLSGAGLLLFVLPKLFISYLIAPLFSSLVQGLPATSCSHLQCEDPGNCCCWSSTVLAWIAPCPWISGRPAQQERSRNIFGTFRYCRDEEHGCLSSGKGAFAGQELDMGRMNSVLLFSSP